MTVLIRQHETLFPVSKDELPSPPSNKSDSQKNAPRSFVGWESTEVRQVQKSDSYNNIKYKTNETKDLFLSCVAAL